MASPHHFTAVGHFYVLNAENCTDPDKLVPITGTIRFSPMLANGDLIRALSAEPNPAGIALSPVTGVIDEDGRVRLKKKPRHPGCCECCVDIPDGVCLVGDSPLLALETPLFYEVSFHNIKFGSRPGSIASFVFQAPCEDGAVVDLVTVMRVPGQLAAGLVEGPPGPPGKDGADGADGKDGADGADGKDGADGADGADGVFDAGSLQPIDEITDDTDILVLGPEKVNPKVVKVSPWQVFKARLETWVRDYLLDEPELGRPEITAIRVPDPGYNDADIAAGIDPPRRNPGYFSVLDAREWLSPEGSPFSTTNKFAYSFRHDLLPDTDAQFIARTRKGGTQLITMNGIDTAAGTSHLVLSALRGNVYATTTGNTNITGQIVAANQVVTAGNIVTLSNKTIQSPTINNPTISATGGMVVNWTAAATPNTKITLGQESVLNSETASQQALSINPKIVRTSISSPLHGVMTLSPRIDGPGAEDVPLITCMPYLNGPPSNVFEVFASGDVVCTSINAGGPDSTMSIFSKIAINQEGMNEQVQVPGTRVVPPVRNNDPGRRGMYAVDNNWLYIAVADNQWKRIALQTW